METVNELNVIAGIERWVAKLPLHRRAPVLRFIADKALDVQMENEGRRLASLDEPEDERQERIPGA